MFSTCAWWTVYPFFFITVPREFHTWVQGILIISNSHHSLQFLLIPTPIFFTNSCPLSLFCLKCVMFNLTCECRAESCSTDSIPVVTSSKKTGFPSLSTSWMPVDHVRGALWALCPPMLGSCLVWSCTSVVQASGVNESPECSIPVTFNCYFFPAVFLMLWLLKFCIPFLVHFHCWEGFYCGYRTFYVSSYHLMNIWSFLLSGWWNNAALKYLHRSFPVCICFNFSWVYIQEWNGWIV